MQLDKAAIDRMLRLDDKQLRQFIDQLAAGAGMSPGSLNVSDADLAALRRTLGSASPEALAQLAGQLTAQNRGMNHGK
ncbi:MAG: hypothetical protein IJX53_05000 [Clostridia bacterium]|nr:hypothetical protein [Clostridia bacterium]